MAAAKPFRYGTLLRVRQRQEDAKSTALAQMRRAVRSAEEQHREIVGQQLAAFESAAALACEQFDASDIRRYFVYERHLSRLAVEKDAEIAHLRREEDERRSDLEEAMKRRKVLEKLKSRKDEALKYMLGQEEQKRVDEAAVNRAAQADGPRKS